MKFPALMYTCPGPHRLATGTYDYIEVRNDEQVEKALASGFFHTIPEAVEAFENPKANGSLDGQGQDGSSPRRGRPPKVVGNAT